VTPDVAIIAAAGRGEDLRRRIADLGYRAERLTPLEFEHLPAGASPTVLVVDLESVAVRPFLTRLRAGDRTPPCSIVLHGALGGEIRDLADLLEIGADRLLGAPLDPDELRTTLADLVGSAADAVEGEAPHLTAPLDEPAVEAPTAHDPLLAQLRRTLAHLAEHDEGDDTTADDGIDLAAMGLGALPRLEATREDAPDPADLALPLVDAVTRPIARQRPLARPHSTLRLDDDGADARPPVADASTDRHTLALLGVPGLLWQLHRAAFTGRLALVRGDQRVDLWLVHGEPRHLASSRGDDLIEWLARRGLLTDHDARLAIESGLADPRGLVEAGLLKPREAAWAPAARLRDHLAATFGWSQATWSIHEGERPPDVIELGVTVADLILDGTIAELDTPEIWRRLGDRRQRPRWRSGVDETRLRLVDSARIADLDGSRTLAELASGGRSALALVLALVVLGHVDLVDGPGHDPAERDRQRIAARLALARQDDPLALLGLDPAHTAGAVRRAHRALVELFAPERVEPHTAATLVEDLTELRAALDHARDSLLGPDER